MSKRASDEVLLAGILLARIERWLGQEGVFHRSLAAARLPVKVEAGQNL